MAVRGQFGRFRLPEPYLLEDHLGGLGSLFVVESPGSTRSGDSHVRSGQARTRVGEVSSLCRDLRDRRIDPLRRDRDIQIKGCLYALQTLRQLVAVFAI
jgi:hypothetical protein